MAEKKTKDAKDMNIYEKMLEVMKSIERLQKDTGVEYNGRTQYRALSEEKVTSTVRAKFVELGMVVFPFEQEVAKEGNITTTNSKYKMVNVHNPEDYVILASSGQGADTQDKGVGKAMTYAYKYMLLRTFAIPTGEDPDKIHSDTITDMQKNEEDSKKYQENVEKLRAELKDLLEETDSDVSQFLKWCEQKFERKVKNVDVLHDKELEVAIARVKEKKEGDK